MGRRQLGGVDHAHQGGAGAGEHVDVDLHPVGLDAGHPGRPLVAAHGVDVPAEGGLAEHDGGDDAEDDEQDGAHRDAQH